jgi:hypothetical protein
VEGLYHGKARACVEPVPGRLRRPHVNWATRSRALSSLHRADSRPDRLCVRTSILLSRRLSTASILLSAASILAFSSPAWLPILPPQISASHCRGYLIAECREHFFPSCVSSLFLENLPKRGQGGVQRPRVADATQNGPIPYGDGEQSRTPGVGHEFMHVERKFSVVQHDAPPHQHNIRVLIWLTHSIWFELSAGAARRSGLHWKSRRPSSRLEPTLAETSANLKSSSLPVGVADYHLRYREYLAVAAQYSSGKSRVVADLSDEDRPGD